MKALGKILGLFFLGLLLIIVALGFALTHLFDPNDYKDEIRQIARDKRQEKHADQKNPPDREFCQAVPHDPQDRQAKGEQRHEGAGKLERGGECGKQKRQHQMVAIVPDRRYESAIEAGCDGGCRRQVGACPAHASCLDVGPDETETEHAGDVKENAPVAGVVVGGS